MPRKGDYRDVYEKYWKVTDIFPVNCTGIVTARDKFVISFDREALRRRIEKFRDLSLSDDLIRHTFKLKENYMWRIKKARNELSKVLNWEDNFTKVLYRPFDIREIYFHDSVVWRTRKKVMRHMMRENISLCAMRQVSLDEKYTHFLVSQYMVDNRTFLSSKGIIQQFPLYLYPDKSKGTLLDEKVSNPERVPNISKDFLHAVKEALSAEPTPEEIFYYIYAVLYSPTYRKRCEEFLKIDFPRVPLPSDLEKFKNLSELGKELVELHLLKHPSLSETEIGLPVSGSNMVGEVRYDEENRRVYFNKEQYFEGVSKAAWEYRIGGYQVMAKYLKDRKKRELSLEEIEHYMRVTKAIERTIKVQGAVEEVYAELGGARNL
ncbi:MAG: type ISP restriction/modification enzyme [Halobacteriota archaeon]